MNNNAPARTSEPTSEPTSRACLDCQFYCPNDDYNGECRRNAPRTARQREDEEPDYAAWPVVMRDDWCGEWEEAMTATTHTTT